MSNFSFDADEIDRRFDLHTPDENTGHAMTHVRARFKDLAATINTEIPAGREASLAFTHLEIALFYAIGALARDRK